MRREEGFVHSHRPYAVDLSTLSVSTLDGGRSVRSTVRAVWFRGTVNAPVACTGKLWNIERTAPSTAEQFLARHTDGRYGGECESRWTGESFWTVLGDPEESAADLAFLRTALAEYPALPDGCDGWWTFRA
jgi:hypothetical protein